MTEYKVSWSIDVDADDPDQAAKAAMEVMLNPSFDTAVFRVTNEAKMVGEDNEDFVLVKISYPAGWRSSDELRELVIASEAAAEGDSNDTEIDTLREALYLASSRWPEIAE